MRVEDVLRQSPEELLRSALDFEVCLLNAKEFSEFRAHLTTGGPEVWAVFDFSREEIRILENNVVIDDEAGTRRVREYLDRLDDYLGEFMFLAPWLRV